MSKSFKKYKLTPLILSPLIIISMGACSRNVDASKITTSQAEPTTSVAPVEHTTEASSPVKESLIFETTATEVPVEVELTTERQPEYVEARFATSDEMKMYLENLYQSSGKSYWEILNEAEENLDYENDLVLASSYKLLIDNNISIESIYDKLEYILLCSIIPSEYTDEDVAYLNELFTVLNNQYNPFLVFRQLAEQNHLLTCDQNHEYQYSGIMCDRLRGQLFTEENSFGTR